LGVREKCISIPIALGTHRVGYVHRGFCEQLTPKFRIVPKGFECQGNLQIYINDAAAQYFD